MSDQSEHDEGVPNDPDDGPTTSPGEAQAPTGSEQRPRVLVISIVYVSWIEELYTFMLDAIRSKAELHHATESLDAFIKLSSRPPPNAVIVTDEAVTIEKYAPLRNGVLQYIREGGTAIFTCLFSCFLPRFYFNRFFQWTGLNWRWKSPRDVRMFLNKGFVPEAIVGRLPKNFMQTAVLVDNVDPEDLWYQNLGDWLLQRTVLGNKVLYIPTNETAAALGRVGEGKIGYVSDIVLGNGSLNIVLAMCGIL